MKKQPKKLNVLGVCGGSGVCLFPFQQSKYFRVIGNSEPRQVFYTKDNEHWEANFPGIPMTKDLKVARKRVDVIIGHPDCGDSSILRMSRAKKAGKREENLSILHYFQAILFYKPRYFLLENLPGFLLSWSLDELSDLLEDRYHLQAVVESVSLFGNPQLSRKRLVIVGQIKTQKLSSKTRKSDCDLGASKLLRFPKRQDHLGNYPSEYYELGPDEDYSIGHVREPLDKTCNLYYKDRRQITYREARDIWNTEYKGLSRWPVGGKMKNQPGVSRHIVGEAPLTVRKQNRQFGTSGLVLSPREMANIQGVDVSYKLIVKKSNSIYWINKMRLAVTKTMPMEIASWFKKEILKQHRK